MKILRLLLLTLSVQIALAAYREGDFIPASRKTQVAQLRTNWEDLLGQFCPRFGYETIALLPLLKPKRYNGDVEDYKLQFSFGGDQHITPWVTVLGKHAPPVPMLIVKMVRTGDDISRVNVEVHPLPQGYKMTHGYIFEMFRNTSHWPKDVLVHYKYEVENEVDLSRGLYLLYFLGLSISAVIIFNSLRSYHGKLKQFLQETAFDEFTMLGRQSWNAAGKGE